MKQYEIPHHMKSIWQMINTLVPFFALWVGAYFCLSVSYWLTLLLSVIAGFFLIRAFIIFHDCCHKSFFKSRVANNIVGTLTGILVFFPYQKWAMEHNIHHATSSNLDKRGIGDLWIWTIDEYQKAHGYKKILYRLYHHPILMLGIGPALVFLIQYRFNRRGAKLKERLNTYLRNIILTILVVFLCWLIGWKSFLLVEVPIFFVSGAIGVWLFFIQHTFEDTYFERDKDWTYVRAAMQGSSFYNLPLVFQWLTGNIGFHHIHHLSSRIPNYNLKKAHEENPDFQQAETVTLARSLQSVKLSLWDERNKKFISFRELPL
ncbi:fatty acid desaturase (plasmid) [Aneurinibacillus sp. Ricciae_BoGa-3]|nr:fatty acid desaturase [Aneurinibacillus sp. Ricciae_BoGa-3]WCK57768.1 fatty acid desaturase [Aneurinibacillus sp. Ricciae_BoGa-3]